MVFNKDDRAFVNNLYMIKGRGLWKTYNKLLRKD